MKNIGLGATYRDIITGFEGIALGHVVYLSGCNQTLLAPKVNADGVAVQSCWYDDQRMELQEKPIIRLDNGDTPGCAKQAACK